MKIGILTFHHAHNYGAVLQAFALKRCVTQMGHEVEIVNYQNQKIASVYPPTLLPRFTAKTLNPKNWKQFVYDFLRGIYGNKAWKTRWRKCEAFIREHLEVHGPVLSEADMNGVEKDAWLLGSDQIWSSFLLGRLDPVYFGARKKSGKTISYAASMLHAELADGEEEEFKALLENVDVISVREEKLADTLRTLSGREITVTCDPTLLLEAEDFTDLFEDKSPVGEPYIFAYFVVEEELVQQYAERIAKETGYKLIALHYNHMPENSGEGCLADLGPGEFLQYIRHAEYVVTNSFHGAVFSVLFEKKFYSVFWKNGRVSGLMKILGLEERIFTKESDPEQAVAMLSADIDYATVNEKRQAYKERSLQFLRENL